MNALARLLMRLHRGLTSLYPRAFRQSFRDEMIASFADAADHAAARGSGSLLAVFLREVRDLPAALIREHGAAFRANDAPSRKEWAMNAHDASDRPPAGTGELLAGSVLFVLMGFRLITGELPYEWITSNGLAYNSIRLWLLILLPSVGYCIGWIRGFPRWAYPYPALMLLTAYYISGAATPGLRFFGYVFGRGDLWDWRAWIPALAATLIALIVTRSVKPLVRFFTAIGADWTLGTFALFGCMPLLIWLSFDEMDRLYSLVFVIALTALMTGTAVLYLRATSLRQRAWTIGAGVALTLFTTSTGIAVFAWITNGFSGAGWIWLMALVTALLMLSPGLIGVFQRRTELHQPA